MDRENWFRADSEMKSETNKEKLLELLFLCIFLRDRQKDVDSSVWLVED